MKEEKGTLKISCVYSKLSGHKPCYAGVLMSTIVKTGMGIGDVISLFCVVRASLQVNLAQNKLECLLTRTPRQSWRLMMMEFLNLFSCNSFMEMDHDLLFMFSQRSKN